MTQIKEAHIMEKQVSLRMLNFNFIELKFELNPTFVWPKRSVVMDPIIEKKITKIDENKVEVCLFFRIDPNENKPFASKVALIGVFECKGWEKDKVSKTLVEMNTVNILFPYLRQAVTNLTTTAGVPPYILPIINTQTIQEKVE